MAAAEVLQGAAPAAAPVVDLVERTETLEVELAATLHLLGQRSSVSAGARCGRELAEARVNEIIELGLRHRGRHDEALRAFHAGAALRFDILMDIGGFRDMHRHRRCVQIKQGFTAPARIRNAGCGRSLPVLAEAGVLGEYQAAIEAAHAASGRISRKSGAGSRAVRSLCTSRSPHACGVCSRWILPKRSTSASFGPRPPATSVIAASRGRCSWPCSVSILRWHGTSA